MPPKGKKKGQKLSLNEFTGPIDNAVTHDWAEDAWVADVPSAEAKNVGGLFSHGVNAQLGDFRSEERAALSTVVPEDMEPPFIAHVGNLTHGISEAELREGFEDESPVMMRIVRSKGATFAFVEFPSRELLQSAIFKAGTFVKGRPLKVDVATKQQQERMQQQEGRGGGAFADLSRDAIGAAQQPSWEGFGAMGGDGRREPPGELSRDVFGAEQPTVAYGGSGGGAGVGGGGGGGALSREDMGSVVRGGGSGGAGGFGELSRDFMGQAPQPAAAPGGGERGGRWGGRGGGTPKASSPVTRDAPGTTATFGANWRDEAPVEQPKPRSEPFRRRGDAPRGGADRGPSGEEDATAKGGSGGSWRRGGGGSDKAGDRAQPSPAADAPRAGGGGGGGGGSWRRGGSDDAPRAAGGSGGGGKDSPAPEAKPRAPQRVTAGPAGASQGTSARKPEPKSSGSAPVNRFELLRK